MDDDIDIEEHDLMDNPKIKSIFPDLSCVKIEIPDEEEFEEHYDEVPEETDDPPQHMGYQYEYSFEPPDNVPETSAAYENEQIEFIYSNRIILGSKPCRDTNYLYEEALNSHPIVYLENWEPKLQASQCFCETCKILFPTVNALDAHKMISHSYLIALDTAQKNTARKSTVTSKFCNHCSKMFPDDTSLIKHLYELLPLNKFQKTKEDKVELEIKEYTCQKCKKVFPNIAALRWHEKNNHHLMGNIQSKKVKVATKTNKVKVTNKDAVKEKSSHKKLNREGKFFYSSSLVPKNTLFQCRLCQICFISCFSASQHSKMCGKVLPWKKCGVCKRKIRAKDAKTHELQHTYAEKLKIYTVYKNIYDKVLCRCPKCESCLDELGFWAHYKICKKHEKRSYCTDCDIYIAANRYDSHMGKHTLKKLTKKDFIIIEFHNQKVKNAEISLEDLKMKRISEKRRETYQRKKSNDKEIHLYFCDTCRCCLYKLQFNGHTNGRCKSIHQKKICEKCGLCFTAKSIACHILRHQKREFTLKDIKIHNLFTGVQIEPPITELYKCKSCEIYFLYPRLARQHDCGTEKHVDCKICFKKFNLQAYKVHKHFHPVDTFMPELIEKYKSITNTWSVIYMCAACDLVTMTYDSVVTHCQRHLNYINSDNRKYCSICDLQIAVSDYASHDTLHQNNASIDRASFKILIYNYEDLFKKKWMDLFRPLQRQHRAQILSNSVYRYTRSIKMQVEKSGATDDIHYICMICKTVVEGTCVENHVNKKCERSNKFICNICNSTCKTLKNYISHDCRHEKIPTRSTIVSFNNETDKKFDNQLRHKVSQSTIAKTKEMSKDNVKETEPDVKKSYIIYKCVKCKVCVNLKSSINRHRCVAESDRTFCRICQQYITSKKIRTHTEAHRKKPSVNKNTLSVVYFNPDEKLAPNTTVNQTAKILRCNCGLHFTSLKSIHKHLDICKPDLEISKEVCSKCNLLFPTDVLVTHLVNHHHKEVKIDIETILRVNLYKCTACTLLFTTQSDYYEHISDCDPKNGSLCVDCNIKFGKKCLAKHRCTGKTPHVNKIIKMNKSVQLTTVYQCDPCEICYLNYKSFQYHSYDVKHKNKITLITCDSCGLRFTCHSFQKHKKIHKLGKLYKIKVISAISKEFVIISGRNKHMAESSPRKRKLEATETVPTKRTKTYEGLERTSRRLRKLQDIPSTSKDWNSDENIVDNNEDSQRNSVDSDKDNIDDNDPADKSAISRKLKARISINNYDHTLYKCIYCNQHFMKQTSFDYHIKAYLVHTETENYKCEICDLDFSRYTLPRHQYIHHKGMSLKREDFNILIDTSFTKDNDLFSKLDKKIEKSEDKVISVEDSDIKTVGNTGSCEDIVIFSNNNKIGGNDSEIGNDTGTGKNNSETGQNGTEIGRTDGDIDQNDSEIGQNDTEIDRNGSEIDKNDSEIGKKNSENGSNDSEIGRNDSDIGRNDSENGRNDSENGRNDSENGRNDSDIGRNDSENGRNVSVVVSNDSEIDKVNKNNSGITETVTKVEVIEKKYYFKCAECNVCFIDKKICMEHTVDHTILDPKMYIQCKICCFQFMIDSLKDHMDIHHDSDFIIESLTIHEYKPLGAGMEPKLDIYQAVDKVQSRLVSTTTDMGVV